MMIQQTGDDDNKKHEDNSQIDLTSTSSEIDAKAQAFVDSDDVLNEQIEEISSKHIVINKGYPYTD